MVAEAWRQAGFGLDLQSGKASGKSKSALLGDSGRLLASPDVRCSCLPTVKQVKRITSKRLVEPLELDAKHSHSSALL